MVILNISEVSLYSQYLRHQSADNRFFLTDGSGTIVSARDKQLIGSIYAYTPEELDASGGGDVLSRRIDGGQIRLYERIPGTDWYLVEEMSASAAFGTLNLVRNGAFLATGLCAAPDSGGASLRLPADSPPHHPAPGQPGPGQWRAAWTSASTYAERTNSAVFRRPSTVWWSRSPPFWSRSNGRSGRSIWRSWIFSRPRSTPLHLQYPQFHPLPAGDGQGTGGGGDGVLLLQAAAPDSLPLGGVHPPGEELDTLKCYVELQHLRYPDTFDYSCEVDEALRDNTLPKLLLQPVVENSIFHGVGRHKIHIRLRGLAGGGHPDPPGGGRWSGHFQRQDRPGDEQGLAD